jgi:hypothetical protein
MMRVFRLSLALAFLLAAAACASSDIGAGGGSGTPIGADPGHPDGSTSSSILPRPTGDPPTRPNQATADGRAVNLHPVRWDRVQAGAGRQVLIYYTVGGVRECGLLGRVEVAETATSVTLTVLLGQAPGADCTGPQPMIAATYVTAVTLAQPFGTRIARDGASGA